MKKTTISFNTTR
ncbi:Hypothetical protein EIN_025680, partial [Entamoeba invadens IP1]